MGQVMIRCPITEDLVPTGMEASSTGGLDQPSYLLIDCLECGQDHSWEPSEATIAGAVQVSSSQWAW